MDGDADQLYQRALALEDPNSMEAATTMEFYSFFLRNRDRNSEAAPLESRAQEVRRGLVAEMLKKEFAAGSAEAAANIAINAGGQPVFATGAGSQPSGVPTKAAAAKQPQTASGAFRVGDGVLAPKLLKKVEPAYSEEARAMKFAGTVILSVEIGVDGRANNIQVRKSLGLGLDENAVEAVTQWVFQPGTKDGAPVPVVATIEVNFRLM